MSSPRSLLAARQNRRTQDQTITEPGRTNGWFWSKRSMNDQTTEGSMFSFRSMFSPLSSPTNMPQSDEQTKDLPQPALSTHKTLAPSHDYTDKAFRRFHHHNLSESTAGSNDSSPTTTISTVDDSSATEPSPGSSPESPPPSTFTVGMLRPRTSDDNGGCPFFELQKQPPPKKGRNLKGLAVNTARHPGRAASTTSLPLPPIANTDSLSSAASPSFVKPPTPPKRKPSNLGLTLLTPSSSKAPPQEIRLAIPPTPAFSRPGTLRHFQSSPSLPLFPVIGLHSTSSSQPPRLQSTLETIFSPVQSDERESEGEEEQNFDIPLSKEEKPEAYPDGPICVYDPHIDLYLEPTAKQAELYDVIFNVASEVQNPFLGLYPTSTEAEPEIRIDGGGGIQFAPKRDRLPVETAENAAARDNSPSTPKATPLNSSFPNNARSSDSEKEPEYIHVKWEHNSDIVPDLFGLVKQIDDKVMQGKRVLIHCQCGVSRSASLVVAYGLYKNPTLSVQEAYDAVKKRSKWIGPNMNLIMQLQEFRTSLMHGGLLSTNRALSPITPASALSEWAGPFSMKTMDCNAPLSAGVAPLTKAQTADSLPALSAGPSSAPSGFVWPLKDHGQAQRARAVSAVKPGTAYVNPSGHVVPVVPTLNVVAPDVPELKFPTKTSQVEQIREESDSATPTEPTTPRSEEFAMTPLQPSPDVDPADAFGLMSPSSTEFSSSPFDRSTLLAQLGMGPVRQQEEAPRRSVSLRSRSKPRQRDDDTTPIGSKRTRRLRGKISSPSIREQQQLQSLQANIEASLSLRSAPPTPSNAIDEGMMSPRATEFTKNPFALSMSMSIPTSPISIPQPSCSDSDPRSPAHKGSSPIIRSIFDVL